MAVVVSAYYKIPNKATHEKYMEYMKLFFRFFKGKRVLFFTESSVLDELHEQNIDVSGFEFILKKFNDLPILTKFPYSFWQRQKERDVEKYHTPELGIIWASKKEFIREASEMLPNEEWFFWMDAGCVRTEDVMKFSTDFGNRGELKKPGVYVGQFYNIPLKEFFMYPDVYIGCGLNAFHRDYIQIFCDKFDDMLKKYDEAKVSATSDQYIVSSILVENTDWIFPVHYSHCKGDLPKDLWFFFLAYL